MPLNQVNSVPISDSNSIPKNVNKCKCENSVGFDMNGSLKSRWDKEFQHLSAQMEKQIATLQKQISELKVTCRHKDSMITGTNSDSQSIVNAVCVNNFEKNTDQ